MTQPLLTVNITPTTNMADLSNMFDNIATHFSSVQVAASNMSRKMYLSSIPDETKVELIFDNLSDTIVHVVCNQMHNMMHAVDECNFNSSVSFEDVSTSSFGCSASKKTQKMSVSLLKITSMEIL
mgnify:CR=1 FL=1